MEQRNFCDDNTYPTNQEIYCTLLSLSVHCRFHKRSPLVSILGQMNSVYTSPFQFPKIHSYIILPPTLRSCMCSSFEPIYCMNISSLPLVLHVLHITPVLVLSHLNMWWIVQVVKLFIMHPSSAFYLFLPLRSKYSSQHLVPKHPQSMCWKGFYSLIQALWRKHFAPRMSSALLAFHHEYTYFKKCEKICPRSR